MASMETKNIQFMNKIEKLKQIPFIIFQIVKA